MAHPSYGQMPAVVEVCYFRNPRFYCPAYSAPPPSGRRVEEFAWFPGDRATIIETRDTQDYVSGLTEAGVWVNLWCRRNSFGKAPRGGVTFCRLVGLAATTSAGPLDAGPADVGSSRASGD
jgi:hypothetical protein